MQTVSKLNIRSLYLVFTYDSVCLRLANRLRFGRVIFYPNTLIKTLYLCFFVNQYGGLSTPEVEVRVS